MAECEFLEKCPFFNDKLEKKAEAGELKEKYCSTNNLHCARYMVSTSVGPDYVEKDLMPDEKMRAYGIIAENS